MLIEILTIFPEIINSYIGSAMLKRAEVAGHLTFNVRNIREYAIDKHKTTDDSPYGGGPGMVMKPAPIATAFDAIASDHTNLPFRKIYFSPQGRTLTHSVASQLAREPGLILLCGRYEGVDERIIESYIDDEISLGDFVLTGGELPALCLIDAVARLIPGVLGNDQSAENDSFSSGGILDHPHYTRPEVFRNQTVPEVLLSGNHRQIEKWRRHQALARTLKRRPELIEKARPQLTPGDLNFLAQSIQQNTMPGIPPADPAQAADSMPLELQDPRIEPGTPS